MDDDVNWGKLEPLRHLLVGFCIGLALLIMLAVIGTGVYVAFVALRWLWYYLANLSAWCNLAFALCLAGLALAALDGLSRYC
jgi:hypothetical protein